MHFGRGIPPPGLQGLGLRRNRICNKRRSPFRGYCSCPDRLDHKSVWRNALMSRSCDRELLYVLRELQRGC